MNRKLYMSVEATSSTEARINIKGYISSWRNSADTFEAQVDELIANGITNVRMYINSGGGSVFEANEIANIIKRFQGTITAEIGAICASAATILILPAQKIEMASNGQMMIHRPMTEAFGNEDQLKSSLKLLQTLQNNFLEQYSKKTGLKKEVISALWQNDYWMDAKEAKEKGFVDSIIGETEAIEASTIQAMLNEKIYKNIPQSLVAIATKVPEKPNLKTENMKVVALTLGLSADAPDADVQAAIVQLKAKADKADEYKAELDSLKTNAITQKVEALVNTAVADKKIAPTQKEHFMKLATSDFDTTKSILDAMPKAIVVTDSVIPINSDKKSFDDYSPAELEALMEADPKAYEALINKSFNVKK